MKSHGERPVEISRRIGEYDIKMDVNEVGYEDRRFL
jgi:hypothetical protein